MKAVIYCRVSTEGQEQDGTSLQTQLEACQKYCQNKSYEVAHNFSEAYSGLSLERPELDKLRELIRTGAIEAVIVYSLDRLTRDPVHGVILMQDLEKCGVKLEAVTDTVDNSETGKLIYYIKGYAAKLDAARRRDATGRGKRALLKQGKLPQGTGKGLFGYNWDKEAKKRVVNPSEADIVREIFFKIANGKSLFSVALELNNKSIPTKAGTNTKWHPLTLKRIVMNPAYYGMTIFNQTHRIDKTKTQIRPKEEWIELPDITPAIIDRDLFDKAQNALKQSRSHTGKAIVEYPLRGHVYCPECGSRLTGTLLGHKYRYYQCAGTKPTVLRKSFCKAKYIQADWLEHITFEGVSQAMQHPEVIFASVKKQIAQIQGNQGENDIDRSITRLNNKLKGYDGRRNKIMSLFSYEAFTKDELLDQINEINQEKQADEQRLAELLQTKSALIQLKETEIKLQEYQKTTHDLSTGQGKALALDALNIKVLATRDNIDVTGNYPPDYVTIERTLALPHGHSCPSLPV
jgi:site-specific DNA recombinase